MNEEIPQQENTPPPLLHIDMSRRIICQKCNDKRGPQHPLDVADGWHRRIVPISAKKPETHNITFLSDSHPPQVKTLASLFCDDCGQPIQDGQQAFAVTMWRGPFEPESWEQEYST